MRRSAMMLLSLLVAVALCVPASAAIETVSSWEPGATTGPVLPGWNLIALPAIPTNPDPHAVLDEYPFVCENGDLKRWDAATQSLVTYDEWAQETFGNLLITDGYWLVLGPEDSGYFTYEGITDNDDTDMWISLPRAGWTLIGCPFSYAVDFNTVEVTDGTATVPIANARDNQWLDTICYWWENTGGSGNLRTMGLDDDWTESTMLQPWHGYWIRSMRDNLALIVPAAS